MGPVWYFFHDDTFDAFDAGKSASPGLRRIAHTGYGGLMRDEFLSAKPDGIFLGLLHGILHQNPELFDAREQSAIAQGGTDETKRERPIEASASSAPRLEELRARKHDQYRQTRDPASQQRDQRCRRCDHLLQRAYLIMPN